MNQEGQGGGKGGNQIRNTRGGLIIFPSIALYLMAPLPLFDHPTSPYPPDKGKKGKGVEFQGWGDLKGRKDEIGERGGQRMSREQVEAGGGGMLGRGLRLRRGQGCTRDLSSGLAIGG